MNQATQQHWSRRRFKRVHFIGIGGVGMSGIAEVLLNLGFSVSGSDQQRSATLVRLESLGARCHIGHRDSPIAADVVVTSSAIGADNPELLQAHAQRIPVIPRAQMLGELMRFRQGIAVAGSHGKTTTTSLTATLLAAGELDPTFVIGGVLNSAGSNARLGAGDFLVAEADESDGSFLMLQPVIAVITNIDEDHLESYDGDMNRLREAFVEFVQHLPFWGLAVVCVDDPNVQAIIPELSRSLVTYGFSEQADVRASDVEQEGATSHFQLHLPNGESHQVHLNLPGAHNVQNALAAIAVAWELDVPAADCVQALTSFQGIGRRFNTYFDVACRAGHCTIVDDYGHHPTELQATINAARQAWPDKRLLMVFQPHRYTRTREQFDAFVHVLGQVDAVVLSEVYAASEDPIPGADSKSLCRAIRASGRLEPVFVPELNDVKATLNALVEPNDVILVCGAGDIGRWCQQLLKEGLR